jgi:GntR family transcriptional regulator
MMLTTEASAPLFSRISDAESLKLHEVVRQKISDAILAGGWIAGDVLPSEIVLANTFGVSVGTVRKALSVLTSEGVLMRRRKTGTVVTGWAQIHNLSHFYKYFRLHGKDGRLLKSKTVLLDYTTSEASQLEIEKLNLESSDRVIHLSRIRYIDKQPVMLDFFSLPEKLFPDFPEKEDIPELLYLFLFERYGIHVAAVRENITAELAGETEAELLDLELPHAVLKMEELAFDQTARPVIFSVHQSNTTGFTYINEIR